MHAHTHTHTVIIILILFQYWYSRESIIGNPDLRSKGTTLTQIYNVYNLETASNIVCDLVHSFRR